MRHFSCRVSRGLSITGVWTNTIGHLVMRFWEPIKMVKFEDSNERYVVRHKFRSLYAEWLPQITTVIYCVQWCYLHQDVSSLRSRCKYMHITRDKRRNDANGARKSYAEAVIQCRLRDPRIPIAINRRRREGQLRGESPVRVTAMRFRGFRIGRKFRKCVGENSF